MRRCLLFCHLAAVFLDESLILLTHQIRQLLHGLSLAILDDLAVTDGCLYQSAHLIFESFVFI